MYFQGLYSKQNYFQGDKIWHLFYPFLISAFLGEDKFICVRSFEIIGEYSTAACTRSGAFLEQIITTSKYPQGQDQWAKEEKGGKWNSFGVTLVYFLIVHLLSENIKGPFGRTCKTFSKVETGITDLLVCSMATATEREVGKSKSVSEPTKLVKQ